ncbi:MAG: hypothetical protein LUD74_00300, partial [Tannerellaceae bacterium]|nr:hypothetical protein [Tannerellaceae bacterium]
MKQRFYFLLVGLALLSCSKIKQSNIPIYEVYFKIDLRYEDKDLKGAPLNSKEFTKPRNANEKLGFGGLLVVCGHDLTYYAFDRSCPYEAKKSITIVYGTDGTATCPTCESVFEVGYGSGLPTSGPATNDPKIYHLRRYGI